MGRPTQYIQNDVLQSAVSVFWNHGYEASSMIELIQATGLKSGSIYAGFGSKQQLFEASIDYYAKLTLKKLTNQLNKSDDYLLNIRLSITGIIENSLNCNNPNGCFLVNTMIELAPHNKPIQQRVKGHIENVEKAFKNTLDAAKKSGQLAEDKDLNKIAKKIMINIWGINVLQRTGLNPEEVEIIKIYYSDIV